jgi:hypothetical protein
VSDQNHNFLSNGKELSAHEVDQLMAMNEVYTHVLFGSKNKIACLKPCMINGQSHIFMSLEEFANYTSHYPSIAGSNAGRAWFKWPNKNRRTDGVGFYPAPNSCPENFFNTYIPTQLKPKEGDCSIYLQHIEKIICHGDKKTYEYLMQFLAHIVQKPAEKPTVAIVVRSIEGTGKGMMVRPLLPIFGAQGVHLNGDRHITGQFNGAIANKLLIFADEVDLTSSNTADKLKAFISESTIQLEKKGLEAIVIPNYARVIFASNRPHVIAAGLRERRYLVLEPDAHKAQNDEYFKKLNDWIENEGAEKLFHYLNNVDIATFNPFKAPITEALVDQKLQSMPADYQFVYEKLLHNQGFTTAARISIKTVIDEFNFWCECRGLKMKIGHARSQIGKLMTAIISEPTGRSGRADGKVYEVPSLEIMQSKFASLLGFAAHDIFDTNEIAIPPIPDTE